MTNNPVDNYKAYQAIFMKVELALGEDNHFALLFYDIILFWHLCM